MRALMVSPAVAHVDSNARTTRRSAAGGRIASLGRYGLALLLTGFLGVALLYAQLVPLLEGFDAEQYFRAATYFRTYDGAERGLPNLDDATVQISYELVAQPPLYHIVAALPASAWPVEPSLAYAEESRNPYFQKVLSKRQRVTLPNASWTAVAPIWSARAVSLLAGLLTVVATWMLVKALFPQTPWLAPATASLVGFNPQFLFMSVTVTNDAWAAATIGLTVALAARAMAEEWQPRGWVWVGLWAGIAILVKYSGFLAAIPAGIVWVLYGYRCGWGAAGRALAYVVAVVLLVAGWWYGRMFWLYGEIVPLGQMAEAIPTLQRAQPFTIARTLEYVPWLVSAYWGIFVANIAPAAYLEWTRYFMLIGFAGALVALLRRRDGHTWRALAVVIPWMVVVALAVLHWTRTVSYGEQGRLAHIGAPAFALTWALGWQAWFPSRWQRASLMVLIAVAIAAALSQAVTLSQAYAIPAAVNPEPGPDGARSRHPKGSRQRVPAVRTDRVVQAQYDAGMKVVGVDFPVGAVVTPDEPMPFTLYLTTEDEITGFYTLFLHLADTENRLLWKYDGVPAGGRHPTRQWRPGEVFADTYIVTVTQPGETDLATLSMGFYPLASPGDRLQAFDTDGNALGDRLILGAIRLQEQRASDELAQAPAVASWENGIELLTYDVVYAETGNPQMLYVTWRAGETLQQDLTVFVQLLNDADEILAQVDVQPQHGAYPTSTWRARALIQDSYELRIGDAMAGDDWSRLIIGFYDSVNGRVLLDSEGDAGDFYVVERHVD